MNWRPRSHAPGQGSETLQARVCRYGAPALLVLVALFQGYRAQSTELSPWKGGGFGMFAVVDQRFLTARTTTAGEESRPLPVHSLRRDLVRRAEYAPTAAHLERVASSLWRREQESLEGSARSLSEIQVVAWRVRFDGQTRQLRRERIGAAVYRPEGVP